MRPGGRAAGGGRAGGQNVCMSIYTYTHIYIHMHMYIFANRQVRTCIQYCKMAGLTPAADVKEALCVRMVSSVLSRREGIIARAV